MLQIYSLNSYFSTYYGIYIPLIGIFIFKVWIILPRTKNQKNEL